MQIIETEHFFKAANIWFCKRCTKQDKSELSSSKKEEETTAKWLDKSRHVLYCSNCGAQEELDKA